MARISVIVPLLNEAANLPALHARLTRVFATMAAAHEFELVFVDDGSTDSSVAVIGQLRQQDPRVRLVQLSRNFGSHAAIAAGFAHATGAAVTVLAADLQDPPELLPQLVAKWESGYDTVWAMRASRDDPALNRFFSQVYHRLVQRIALPTMPPGGVDVCLVSRQVIETMGRFAERNTSIFCLIMWAGFRQCFVPYHREARQVGHSKWTFAKQLKMIADTFVSFSFFPIRLITYLGLAVSLLGFAYAAAVVFRWAVLGMTGQSGWASLMVAVVTLAGVQMLMLGIVAEYLWRTFDAARQRPLFVVRETVGFDSRSG